MVQMHWLSGLGEVDQERLSKETHPYSYDPFTVWANGVQSNKGVHTDRLFQWDHEKHDALCNKHFGNSGQHWADREPLAIEALLREYLNSPKLVLCEIQEHCNQGTGVPVWYLAYKETASI